MDSKIKNRILILFTIILMILSTLLVCNALAETLENKGTMIVKSEHTRNYPDGSYIPYEDLNAYYDVFCCQKGTALPSYNQTTFTANGTTYSFPYLTQNDVGTKIGTVTTSGSTPYSSKYTHKTYGQYKIEGTYKATPEEAYILSEMIRVDGLGEYNYCQIAWWNTEAGSTGNDVSQNAFSLEAQAFEQYIKDIWGITKTGALTESECSYTTVEFTDTETGESYTIENAFDISYEPYWVTDGDCASPTVVYDETTGQFTIGPLSIHYEGSTVQFGSRDEVQFAGITGMELYTDASDEPLVLGEDWDIICAETVRSSDVDYEFPKSDEEFYIRLNYVEGATQISNIKTYFRYMNAAGTYQKLQGKYFIATWTRKSQDNYDDDDEYEDTTYWLELTNLAEYDSQRLALGLNGCRWYQYTELDRNIDIESKSITIKKEVVDSTGAKVDTDDYFTFKVSVSGAINSGDTEKIRVKANSSATTKTYYWLSESDAPTYSVEEIDVPEGYTIVDVSNKTGSLDSSDAIVVKAINQVEEHKGNIEIVKKIQDLELDSSQYTLVGQTFKFKVTVTATTENGTFKYDGTEYESLTLYPEVTAVAESDSEIPWTSGTFTWIGDKNPTYSVEELTDDENMPEYAELVSIDPSEGTLVEDETVKIEAINKLEEVGASIHIIKTLENSEYLSEEEIQELRFYFTIHVDGYEDVEAIATPSRIKDSNGEYIWAWEYTSSEYTWLGNNAPNYTITEHDNPEGTTFTGATSDDNTITVTDQTVSGTLVADEEKDFVVTNNIINTLITSHEGYLTITKVVDTEDLQDRDYLFVATITGYFKFASEDDSLLKKERTIQFTNDLENSNYPYVDITNSDEYNDEAFVTIHVDTSGSSTWSTDDLGLGKIVWYGDTAPTYKVEENLAGTYGEGVKSYTITPSEGSLTDGTSVAVKAENFGVQKKSGTLSIIKTLEDADKYDASYINSLVFKFKITVDGYEPYDVELEAERVDDKYVWEYVSDEFLWDEDSDTGAPNYTIEEIDLPEGTEFVSAEGPDGSSVSGKTISGQLVESENSDVLISTENSFINKLSDKEGYIKIKKDVTDDVLTGKDFTFTLYLSGTFTYNGTEYVNVTNQEFTDITVKGGEELTLGPITWAGENAPTYEVVEVESDIAETVSVINAAGTVTEGTSSEPVNVTFVNEAKKVKGQLVIYKVLADGQPETDDKFTFEITIGDNEPYQIQIEAGGSYTSETYTWNAAEDAPTYKVEEVNIPDGVTLESITNSEGTLIAVDEDDKFTSENTVEVIATNKYEEHKGNFIITKEIIVDKTTPETYPTFTFNIVASGDIYYVDGVLYGSSTDNGDWTYTAEITGEGTWDSPDFVWYGDAPSITVDEEDISNGDGTGWLYVGTSNNGAALVEDDTIEIVVSNRYEPIVIIDLTMELAGIVWEDEAQTDDKNMEGSTANGLLDSTEQGIGGVEVYIYDNEGNLATIYYDMSKNEVEQPIITNSDGSWDAPRVKVLQSGSYTVQFVYDGQTYEPTTPLVSGSAADYIAANDSGRTAWANDSMADDIDRDEVNERLAQISGNTAIDGSGNTTGTASDSNGNKTGDIIYEAEIDEDGSSKAVSKVQTTNDDGTVKDLYKATASTAAVGLTYPFDDRIHLEDFDITLTELGPAYRYIYSATYDYCLHVNLGLVQRDIADMDTVKDLVEAKVVVNEELLTYKFNKLADVGADVLSRESYISGDDGNTNIEYQLGLYATDYYYRAEIYQTSTVYDAMDTFYTSINQTLDETNLEIYLKYKISIYNESPTYLVEINEINDYFDASFGSPITTEVQKYVQTADGEEVNSLQTVAYPSTTSSGSTVEWTVTEENIEGSDGITYNKMSTTSLDGMKLASGEKVEIYVYFKVETTSVDGVNDTIELADKSNIVEISNYSTYYSDGSVAGKIDTDSAPDNINITEHNERTFYEDDTDAAPVLEITLNTEEETRTVSGLAWEDESEDDETAVGNGVYDEGDEALIGGLTTELVEEVMVADVDDSGNLTGTYTTYDFVWPTSENLSCLGGKTLESLTGFDSITETSCDVGDGDESAVGTYEFTGVPTGDYVVRFLYGNDKSELDDTLGITGDPKALKADGTSWNDNANILVANYDGDAYGTTPAVYNGQDFKSTIYQVNNANTLTDRFENNYDGADEDSDAADSESRRLDITANSITITNVNGTVLSTANYNEDYDNTAETYDSNSNHSELYEDYYMYADTARISFSLEDIDNETLVANEGVETVETVVDNSSVKVYKYSRTDEYSVTDVNFGLIERPETNVVLDKEISEIKLTTNDGTVIFDAEYDIEYVVETVILDDLSDKVVIADLGSALIGERYLVANITLNQNSIGTDVMQALDKNENKLTTEGSTGTGTKNFRYIQVEDTILQGTTIQIDYKLSAINVSEQDTTSQTLATLTDTADETRQTQLRRMANELEDANRTYTSLSEVKTLTLGQYVGEAYYTGTKGANDVEVTTRVRQVIDYVDNDGIFSAMANNTENHSWVNTSVNELLGYGYDAERLIDESLVAEDTLYDADGIEYINDQRNNVVLSIDSVDTATSTNNSGFEKSLYSYYDYEDDETLEYVSDITLTITKTVSAEDDADNLTYDNIAEVVKYENVAGRRDEAAIPGNANPAAEDVFAESLAERDQSATELVTFTPPTGIEVGSQMTLQILLVSAIALAVIAVGIVIIKKKVL